MHPLLADTLLIFIAASLNKPMQPVLDAYAARTGTVIQRESGASLEHVRKITELHRMPDVLLLADVEVIPQLLVPKYTTWYAEFARNRIVVAYTDQVEARERNQRRQLDSDLQRQDVEVGRTDPNLAPVGYRTLLMFRARRALLQAPRPRRRRCSGMRQNETSVRTRPSSLRCSRRGSWTTSTTTSPSPSRTAFDIVIAGCNRPRRRKARRGVWRGVCTGSRGRRRADDDRQGSTHSLRADRADQMHRITARQSAFSTT